MVCAVGVKAARETNREGLLTRRKSGLFVRPLSIAPQGTASALERRDVRVEGAHFHNTAASSPTVRVAAILGNSCRREVFG